MDFEIGERVKVDTWDVKGYGTITENKTGVHVLVDGFKDPMYFGEHEVKKVNGNA